MKLTTAFISKDFEISSQVLNAVSFSDEVIVIVDSVENKKEIKKGNVRYVFHPLNNDFASQRNLALQKSSGDWVLMIDDDEYVSTELAKEIQKVIKKTKFAGFRIRRIDTTFHQPLLHGETGHTKLLRLAKKDAGEFTRPVHEVWKINGQVGQLQNPLFHIKDHFVSQFIDRIIHYGAIDAKTLTNENKPFSFWRLLFNPPGKFIQNYFIKGGFLDGTAGLFQAYFMSVFSLTVRVFQWTKKS